MCDAKEVEGIRVDETSREELGNVVVNEFCVRFTISVCVLTGM